jgi:hypothetical protein
MTFLSWATFLRRAANMRAEVQCRNGHYAWLGPREMNWSRCPSCIGWWRNPCPSVSNTST